jgi:hypothetical protein
MATKSNLTRSIEKGDRYGRDGRDNARRVQALYRALRASHGPGLSRTQTEAACLRVAELQTLAESLRRKLLAMEEPTDAMINAVTRAESTAARAGRVLDKLAPPKTQADKWAEAWERAQQGDE